VKYPAISFPLNAYGKPFDSLAVTNAAYQKEKAISPQKDDLFDIWLPR